MFTSGNSATSTQNNMRTNVQIRQCRNDETKAMFNKPASSPLFSRDSYSRLQLSPDESQTPPWSRRVGYFTPPTSPESANPKCPPTPAHRANVKEQNMSWKKTLNQFELRSNAGGNGKESSKNAVNASKSMFFSNQSEVLCGEGDVVTTENENLNQLILIPLVVEEETIECDEVEKKGKSVEEGVGGENHDDMEGGRGVNASRKGGGRSRDGSSFLKRLPRSNLSQPFYRCHSKGVKKKVINGSGNRLSTLSSGPTPTKILSTNHNPYSPCDLNGPRPEIEIPLDASPGRLLLDFNVEQELGNGSFGSVVLCTHRMDGWSYAIKRIRFASLNEQKRFINEVYMMAALSHPNIVQYHSSWIDRSMIYIQMEYCNGGSLDSWWKCQNAPSNGDDERKLCEIIRHALLALEYLHSEKNVVHLDIKPANIFVQCESASHYSFKIGDFGSMKRIPLLETLSASGDGTSISTEFYTMGSSRIESDDIEEGDGRYLAPELLEEQVDLKLLGRADIFAVGCSVLELAGGERINHTESVISLPNGYSREFTQLLVSMLDTDPKKRPSAKQLLNHPLLVPVEWKSIIQKLQTHVEHLQEENFGLQLKLRHRSHQ